MPIPQKAYKKNIIVPREFENPIKKLVLAHSFLYRIFKLPRVLNPIFYIDGLINSIYLIISKAQFVSNLAKNRFCHITLIYTLYI